MSYRPLALASSRAWGAKYLAPLSRGITQQKRHCAGFRRFLLWARAARTNCGGHYNAAMRAAGSLLATCMLVTAYNPRATPEQRAEKKRTFDEMHIVWCAAHGDSDLCKRYRGETTHLRLREDDKVEYWSMHELYCSDDDVDRSSTPQCRQNWAAHLRNARAAAAARAEAEDDEDEVSPEKPAPTKTRRRRDDDDRPPEPPRYRRHRIHKGKELREPPGLAHANHKSPFRSPDEEL